MIFIIKPVVVLLHRLMKFYDTNTMLSKHFLCFITKIFPYEEATVVIILQCCISLMIIRIDLVNEDIAFVTFQDSIQLLEVC